MKLQGWKKWIFTAVIFIVATILNVKKIPIQTNYVVLVCFLAGGVSAAYIVKKVTGK